MQLNKKRFKKALFAASCSLIAGNAMADNWEFDTAVMYYGESDRVQALEGIVSAKKALANGREFSSKLVLDSLTGASANGAVPQSTPQTFTTPSGNGQYTASTSETPLDDTFKDTRVQLAGQWSQPISEDYTFTAGTNVSTEYDYQSLAINAAIGRYLNNKNSTITLGLSYAADNVDPVGGRPVGLSTMVVNGGQLSTEVFRDAFDATRQAGADDTKDTVDLIFGLSQVISRRWITQFNLSLSEVDGYLTDPYKVISEVNSSGVSQRQLYENRPDSRSKQAFFMQSKYHYDRAVWDISYRFTDDDWGVQSHTLESRYRMFFANNSYLEPHFRFYQQREADFYTPFFIEGMSLPEFASADYRIGKLNTYTLGIKYGKKIAAGGEYGIRLEYYNQAPQDAGVSPPGSLSSFDLYPSLDAVILQFDYKF